ncbi:hypothetical protein BDM02DRAFT_3169071 [Thelephora ganbajun]|uniref:Uncharacterized protein n=1 Tax=Thelephora ganbajun TaxID=370292 RepID=A0ACB6ZF41_THEGA|nr:hypothetical protein BDM02DRAFT_3169071 [Thelephora ganbajun]
MRPQSGLQKDVLNLYKRALRIARTKPVETRAKFDILIRYTFRTQASSVSPRQISAIEHLLRKVKRQLEIYEAPLVKDCYVSQEMKEWNRAFRREQDLLNS